MAEKLLKNRYLIEDVDRDKLGEGSFGHTYLAKDNMYHTDQRVVIKHLQPDYSGYNSDQERQYLLAEAQKFFQREALVLKKLGSVSDHIPTLIDYFIEDDEFYIVQERIDGESLGKQFKSGKPQSQIDTIKLLTEILEPLDFVHKEKTIHRDLKPDNLMRRTNGKLVLIDFGAVREIRQTTLLLNGKLRPGSRIGSPGYMPLEQADGLPELASDIYAVGAIGIHAMTGLHPSDIVAQFGRDADGIPKWREARRVGVTNEFAAVLNKMLAVLHNNRYFDAATALEALKPLVVSIPMQPKFQGSLSQEMFTFETAKLELVNVTEEIITKKRGWMGLWESEKPQFRAVEKWQVRKIPNQWVEGFTEDLGNGVSLEMAYVPAGSFTMGEIPPPCIPAGSMTIPDFDPDIEMPQHVVNVPEFYIGRYQVTQEQYLIIMGENYSKFQGAKLPVENVSWDDAQIFCKKLSAKMVKKYRLPSEAEWEYACRAKTDTSFYFGETISTELANYNGDHTYRSGTKGVRRSKTTYVGSFPANGFGLYDMHGNVWEWCEDDWHQNYQGAPMNGEAWHSGNENLRVIKGGSWLDYPHDCRSATRYHWWTGDFRDVATGFRVICAQ